MDAAEALRTTGAVRAFTTEGVGDELIHAILDTARFAPNGGNRQPWHVVVVKDEATRRDLKELYVGPWTDYLALQSAGLTPWSALNDPGREAEILDSTADDTWDTFVTQTVDPLFEAPVILTVHADLGVMVAADRDLDRFPIIAGASVYPFVWSVLVAARANGLGGVVTTMHARAEPAVSDLLGAPDGLALAAVVFLGHPIKAPTKLRRAAVEEFTTIDRLDGPAFTTP